VQWTWAVKLILATPVYFAAWRMMMWPLATAQAANASRWAALAKGEA